jgi:thymidylate synthase (FAD)
MKVKLVTATKKGEKIIAYCARVSSPKSEGEKKKDYEKLLRYCIKKGHWSVFEHAHMTLDITTSLAIAMQMLRHRSFCFQQFSQRYSEVLGYEDTMLRAQHPTNRQMSLSPTIEQHNEWTEIFGNSTSIKDSFDLYDKLVNAGVAKECARMLLPQCTSTRLFMTGNVRDWYHYIRVRSDQDTVQKEHVDIALECYKVFNEQFPTIGKMLGEEIGHVPCDV